MEDNDATLIRLIYALGIRPIRVTDLPAASILLEDDALMLIATNLSRCDRDQVLDAALAHVCTGSSRWS